jgi:MFS family permease
MYQVEATSTILRARKDRTKGRALKVSRNVVLLGLTSLFTDISSEMVATVLPLYVVFGLGATPLVFGIVDGIYQGASALVRMASGFLADRTRRHKEIASVGYGLGVVSKIGLLVFGGASGLAAMVLVDRTGKGIRTAPRDALISLSTRKESLGLAFGVHRAMDTCGAMIGPMLAFSILLAAPKGYDAVFMVSLCFAILGLGVLTSFVSNKATRVPTEPVSMRAAAGLLRDVRLRKLAVAGSLLGVVTLSDAFLYLGLQQRIDFEPAIFPLLYVGTAFAYTLLAIPVGKLADRVGRAKVYVGGYAILLAVYSSLLLPSIAPVMLGVYLLLFGAWYAATDGVPMALASAVLPDELRASGLGLLVTATSLARLGGSLLFGALWTVWGLHAAVLVFAAGLAVALVAAAAMLQARRSDVAA